MTFVAVHAMIVTRPGVSRRKPLNSRSAIMALGTICLAAAPAAGQNADWQLDPLPLLQGEWEYWGPEDNASWGGYAKIRIEGRNVVMVDPLHPDYFGSPWSKVPAGALMMTIEKWTQDNTTGNHQVIIRGTCYDYSNSNGRAGSCWRVLTKFSPGQLNRQSKEISWGFSIFERLRDGTKGPDASTRKETNSLSTPTTAAIKPPSQGPADTDIVEEQRRQELNRLQQQQSAIQNAENLRRQQKYDAEMAAHKQRVTDAAAARRAYDAQVEQANAERAQYARDLAVYREQIKAMETQSESGKPSGRKNERR
jgi:hypothetical protein